MLWGGLTGGRAAEYVPKAESGGHPSGWIVRHYTDGDWWSLRGCVGYPGAGLEGCVIIANARSCLVLSGGGGRVASKRFLLRVLVQPIVVHIREVGVACLGGTLDGQ